MRSTIGGTIGDIDRSRHRVDIGGDVVVCTVVLKGSQ